MNNKSGGRKALNTWVIISETLLYGSVFIALRSLGWFSLLFCVAMLAVQIMAILTNKRNVLAKINRMRKPKMGIVAFCGIIIITKDVMSGTYWLMALGLLLSYILCSVYASNLYKWVIRWEDMLYGQESELSPQVTLTNMDFDVMTRRNGTWVLTRLVPVMLAGGTVFALLWISPIVQWPISGLKNIFLYVALGVAALILGLIPDEVYRNVALETQGNAVTEDPNAQFLREAERMSRNIDFQSGYVIVAVILTLLLITALGVYAYKTSKKKSSGSPSLQSANVGSFKKIQVPFSFKKHREESNKHHVQDTDILLRKKYRQLLKKVAQKGYAIEFNETPDQIKSKLLKVYPHQEEWIQIITNAYCERRYADREPENIDEVLQAFSLLKEENYDRS